MYRSKGFRKEAQPTSESWEPGDSRDEASTWRVMPRSAAMREPITSKRGTAEFGCPSLLDQRGPSDRDLRSRELELEERSSGCEQLNRRRRRPSRPPESGSPAAQQSPQTEDCRRSRLKRHGSC